MSSREVQRELFQNPVLFCRTMFPHWFPSPMPWVHWGILAIMTRQCSFLEEHPQLDKIMRHFRHRSLDDPLDEGEPIFHMVDGKLRMRIKRNVEVIMPRGFSKTTLTNAAVCYCAVFGLHPFIVYVSETAMHAEAQLDNVKRELQGNEYLIGTFGELAPTVKGEARWRQDEIELGNGVIIAAKGRGAQIRGMNRGGKRPSLIIVDDVEDRESVRSETQRAKTREWFFADLLPALPARGEHGVIVLGTLMHTESLLMDLARFGSFNTIKFGAIDPDGEPLWPEHMGMEEIEKKRQRYAAVGQLHSFSLEYLSEVRTPEDAKFKPEYIRYGPVQELEAIAMAVDPAISDAPAADFFAIAVVGMAKGGVIHVLEAYGERGVHPRKQIDLIFEFYQRYRPRHVGIESVSYQTALVHLVREEMFRRGIYFEVEELRYRTRKVERVEGILQPRYAAGYVVHARHFPLLEGQLLDWPAGKKDLPDALAMAVSLLDPHAALAADPEKDLTADEYPPLDEELGEWRTAI